jgi:hypothetical protein
VDKELRKHLEASASALAEERLCRVAMTDHRQHVRETALRLIDSTGKWRSLPWLILATAHGDRPTAELAQGLVEGWFTPPRCNRVFTGPSPPERQMIIEAREGSRHAIDEGFLRKLESWFTEF